MKKPLIYAFVLSLLFFCPAQSLNQFKKKINYPPERPVSPISHSSVPQMIFMGEWPSLKFHKIGSAKTEFVSSKIFFVEDRNGVVNETILHVYSKENVRYSVKIEFFVGKDENSAEKNFFRNAANTSMPEIPWNRYENQYGEITIVGYGSHPGGVRRIQIKNLNYTIFISTYCPDIDIEPLAKFLFSHSLLNISTPNSNTHQNQVKFSISPRPHMVGKDIDIEFSIIGCKETDFILAESFEEGTFTPVRRIGLSRTLRPLKKGDLKLKYVLINKKTSMATSGEVIFPVVSE